MNARQRKKQRGRWRRKEIRLMTELGQCLPYNPILAQQRFFSIPHRRRHWLSRAEFARRRLAFEAEMAREERLIQEKRKTHMWTLAGWIAK